MNIEHASSYGIIAYTQAPRGALFLLVRHQDGHWGFPKGHKEPGELPEDTAHRELLEETGVAYCDILKGHTVTESYRFVRGNTIVDKQVVYFIGTVTYDPKAKPSPREPDIEEARWVDAAEASGILTFAEGRETLAQAVGILRVRA